MANTNIPKNSLPKEEETNKNTSSAGSPGPSGAPESGAATTIADAHSEAERIVAEAREKAAKIAQEAEAEAAKTKKQAEEEASRTIDSAQSAAGGKSGITRIVNHTPSLQYVGDVRILPDDKGSPFTDEQHQEALKNPGYAHMIKSKKLEVK